MNDLIIREAMPGDAPRFAALWEILQQENGGMLSQSRRDNTTQTKMGEARQKPAGSVYEFILFIDDPADNSLVGFATGTRSQVAGYNNALEIVVAIKQTFTGRGWGYKLLTGMEQRAVQSGFQCLTLAVSASNTAALALYEKFGFNTTAIKRDALNTDAGSTSLHTMEKVLA